MVFAPVEKTCLWQQAMLLLKKDGFRISPDPRIESLTIESLTLDGPAEGIARRESALSPGDGFWRTWPRWKRFKLNKDQEQSGMSIIDDRTVLFELMNRRTVRGGDGHEEQDR